MTTETKIRSGPAPLYVQRFADACTCGRNVLVGQGAVWFPYRFSYGVSSRCGDCRRFGFRCYYHRWEHILQGIEAMRRDGLAALPVPAASSPFYASTLRARSLIEQEARDDTKEAKDKMAKAKTHYRAFHYGCQVNGSISDDSLRVRIIRLMQRKIGGRRVDMGKVRAAAAS